MCVRFKGDESGYERWLEANGRGFVFNNFGGEDPKNNSLHRADCIHLRRECDKGKRTVYEKICCVDETCILSTVTEERGRGRWQRCGACFPSR